MPAEHRIDAARSRFLGELRQARAAGRRVPDFFIVGHAKCGTTALYEMLKAHPQIFFPRFKETQFLSRGPDAGASRPEALRPRTLQDYLALFECVGPELCAGEGSTEYLRTPSAAEAISVLSPQARIIAVFREPAAFLRSLHLQLLQVGAESERDLRRAIELEGRRELGESIPRGCAWPPALLYSRHVRYVEQLRRFHDLFGRERVLALVYDDFRADNEAVVRQVLRFLGVDDTVAIRTVEANPTVYVRSRKASGMVEAVSAGHGPLGCRVRSLIKAVTTERVRRDALRVFRRTVLETSPAPPDEQLVLELRRRFADEVHALSEYLGRDLVSQWGYRASHVVQGP